MQKKETNIQKKWKSTMTLRENRDFMVNFFFYFTLLDFQIKLIDWFRNEEKKNWYDTDNHHHHHHQWQPIAHIHTKKKKQTEVINFKTTPAAI